MMKKIFMQEAYSIAENLIAKAQKDQFGIYWETSIYNPQIEDYKLLAITNIYNGSAGITLFFLELFNVSQSKKYQEIAREGIAWVVDKHEKTEDNNYCFLTGNMSIVYLLIRAHEIFGQKEYLEKALQIAEKSKIFFQFKDCEYLNGTAGTILSLLHLYEVSKQNWLLAYIQEFLHQLLKKAIIDKNGIYWDRKHDQIKGLCGFSHGVSGIAYVFLILASYFDTKSLVWLAEKAFEYENQHYSKENGNWADFRKGIYFKKNEQEFEDAFNNDDKSFFEKPDFMTAWCHGAPGIGLANLQGFKVTKKKEYWDNVIIAVETILSQIDYRNSPTICHGILGNIELILEVYHFTKDEKYLKSVQSIAEKVITRKKELGFYQKGSRIAKGEEDGLFLGNAGVGYFYLRLTHPSVPSILMPNIRKRKVNGKLDGFTLSSIKRTLISSRFPRTIALIETQYPEEFKLYLEAEDNRKGLPFLDAWLTFVNQLINTYPRAEQLVDIFGFEHFKLNLDFDNKSFAYSDYKAKKYNQLALQHLKLQDRELIQKVVFTNIDLVIKDVKWDWSNKELSRKYGNQNIPAASLKTLLLPKFDEVKELGIADDFLLIVLEAFQTPMELEKAMNKIILNFGTLSDEEKLLANAAILNQIKEAIAAELLLFQM